MTTDPLRQGISEIAVVSGLVQTKFTHAYDLLFISRIEQNAQARMYSSFSKNFRLAFSSLQLKIHSSYQFITLTSC